MVEKKVAVAKKVPGAKKVAEKNSVENDDSGIDAATKKSKDSEKAEQQVVKKDVTRKDAVTKESPKEQLEKHSEKAEKKAAKKDSEKRSKKTEKKSHKKDTLNIEIKKEVIKDSEKTEKKSGKKVKKSKKKDGSKNVPQGPSPKIVVIDSGLMDQVTDPPVPLSGNTSDTPRIVISSTPIISTPIISTPREDSVPSKVLITDDEVGTAVTSGPPKVPAPRSSSRLIFAVAAGVILLAVLVVSRNHKTASTSDNGGAPSSKISVSMTASSEPKPAEVMVSASVEPAPVVSPSKATNVSPVVTSREAAPTKILAHYSPTGAKIFWAPPVGSKGLTGYNITVSSNGGAFKLLTSVPATQLSIAVTKNSPKGWASFKISAVYSSGKIVDGKAFGLYGQYA